MVLEYKGFIGSVEYDENDNIYFGSVQHIKDLVSYEGSDMNELKTDFEAAVNEYLTICEECNKKSERSTIV